MAMFGMRIGGLNGYVENGNTWFRIASKCKPYLFPKAIINLF